MKYLATLYNRVKFVDTRIPHIFFVRPKILTYCKIPPEISS